MEVSVQSAAAVDASGIGDSHSPGVRRLASQFGALLPFALAATTLAEAAGIHLSASTVRIVPVRQTSHGERRGPSRYAAGLEPAGSFGRRLVVVAHRV